MGYPKQIIRRAIEIKEGSSAAYVLSVLKKEFPNEDLTSLNERTILRWVKNKSELLAEPSIHVEKQPGITPSSYQENWKEHNARLAGVANRLLANDLNIISKWVSPVGQVEYHLFDENEVHLLERLTESDLSDILDENISLAYKDYTEWFFKNCFLPHLDAEWSEELKNKGFIIIAREQSYQLIETLRLLAERKTFKGTCPVCKDWQ